MKKAKIMLMGIAIVGVVSGALAFKAQSFTRQTLYYPTDAAHSFCTNPTTLAITTTAVANPGGLQNYTLVATTTGCKNYTTIFGGE